MCACDVLNMKQNDSNDQNCLNYFKLACVKLSDVLFLSMYHSHHQFTHAHYSGVKPNFPSQIYNSKSFCDNWLIIILLNLGVYCLLVHCLRSHPNTGFSCYSSVSQSHYYLVKWNVVYHFLLSVIPCCNCLQYLNLLNAW